MELLNRPPAPSRHWAALAAVISIAVTACGSSGNLDESSSDAAVASIDSVARDAGTEPESTLTDPPPEAEAEAEGEGTGPDTVVDVDHDAGVEADDVVEDRFYCDANDPHYMPIDNFFPTDAVYYRVRGLGETSVELTEEYADWPGRFIVYADADRLSIGRDGSFVVQPEHDVSFYLIDSRELAFVRDVNDDDELLIVALREYLEQTVYYVMTPLVFDESGVVRWVRYCNDTDDYFEQVQRAVADVGFADADPAERVVRGVDQLSVALWEEGQADLERGEAEAGNAGSPGLFGPYDEMVRVTLQIDIDPSAGDRVCFDQSNAELDGRFCLVSWDKEPMDIYVAAGERVLVTVGVETDAGIDTTGEVLEIAVSDLVDRDVVIRSETTEGQHQLVVHDAP